MLTQQREKTTYRLPPRRLLRRCQISPVRPRDSTFTAPIPHNKTRAQEITENIQLKTDVFWRIQKFNKCSGILQFQFFGIKQTLVCIKLCHKTLFPAEVKGLWTVVCNRIKAMQLMCLEPVLTLEQHCLKDASLRKEGAHGLQPYLGPCQHKPKYDSKKKQLTSDQGFENTNLLLG